MCLSQLLKFALMCSLATVIIALVHFIVALGKGPVAKIFNCALVQLQESQKVKC